jgi:TolA-binding protein
MAPKPQGSGSVPGSLPQLPEWVAWLQLGLTVLLAVLFLATLAKARQQGARIQELQARLEGLENSRALEQTTGLEEQLRATVERLQAVERNSARIDVLSADNEVLRSELGQLRRSSRPEASTPSRPIPTPSPQQQESPNGGPPAVGPGQSTSPGSGSQLVPGLPPTP